MNLYRGLTGYDIVSRIERAIDRAHAWFAEDIRNTGIVVGVMVCVLVTIHGCAYALRSMQ